LTPDADLQAGNALTSGGTQLATLAGPALGGALVALAAPAPAFAIDAGSFVVSAATLACVRSVQRRAAIVGSAAFLAEALFLAVVPYLGGVVLAGAALAVTGVMNGFGNVVMITVFQRWAPPDLLGRLTGLLLLASFGVFPVSVEDAAQRAAGSWPGAARAAPPPVRTR